jgi:2-haloacid dehalogenase
METDRMTAPEAVVFDIGNVLIEWQPERYYDSIMESSERMRMFAEADLHTMNELIDKGAPFRETIYAWADKYPDWTSYIRRWHDNWIDMAAPVIDHSVRLQRALRAKGVPVFVLTNFGVHSFAYAETQFDFLAEFDQRYISGHMKVTKPDPQIFAMLEDDCGVAPERLLFADDRVENIDAALARGWQTHLFEGPMRWAQRLVDAGLLTAEEAV